MLLINESSYTETYAKLFSTADFAPLVPKIAPKVRPDQLQGLILPTQWIEPQIKWMIRYANYVSPEFGELRLLP